MATSADPTLAKNELINWLKGALSVLVAKKGLSGYVQSEISKFHSDLLKAVTTLNRTPIGTTCGSCTTANVLMCPTANFCSKGKRCNKHEKTVPDKMPNIKCHNNLCNKMKDIICDQHRYNQPSWTNSDATKWCYDAFEVAKCFMPPAGYCGKSSLADTDFNGTLSIIINNKRFQNKMAAQLNTQPNICSKVRDLINNDIRHSASYELSDGQLARCIDALRDLLQDPKFLLTDQHAKDAVKKINQLQANTLVITAGDITKVLEEDISKRISKQQQEAIQSILDHLAKVQEVSVASLGEIIEARDKAIKAIQQEAQQQIKNVKQFVKETDDVLFKDLKEDIITYYREHESVIPASPLVDEHNVPIEDLYVLPPMWAYENSYYEPSKNTQKR